MFQYIAKEEVNLSNIAIFYGTMIAGEKSMTFHSKILDPQNAPLNSSLGGAHVVHHKSWDLLSISTWISMESLAST